MFDIRVRDLPRRCFLCSSGFGPRRRNVYYQDSYGRVYRRNPHMRGGPGVRSHFIVMYASPICKCTGTVIRSKYVGSVRKEAN